MPGDLPNAKKDKTTKKLKQAQLPFKILSPLATTPTAGAGKAHSVKKRPFTKDEPGGTKTVQPKKAKTSSSESECVEVSSSSDEPRAASPRRRSCAPLDQFVRVESPVSEVSTSCDLVDLTSEDKENRAEQPPRDAEMTEVTTEKAGDAEVDKGKASDVAGVTEVKAGKDAEVAKGKEGEVAEVTKVKAGKDTEVKKAKVSEDDELTRAKAGGDVKGKAKTSGDAVVKKPMVDEDDHTSAEVGGKAEPNEEETAEPVQTKEGDGAGEIEESAKSSDVSDAKMAKSCDKHKSTTEAAGAADTKTDNKSGALTVESAATSNKSKRKSGEYSDVSEAKTTISGVETPSTTPGKDADVPISVAEEKSPAEEPAPATDNVASTKTTKPAEDDDSTKTTDPEPETEDQTHGDASDSDKDGDADDESADDIVMLDETKLKPTEGEAASGAGKTAGSTTPSTKRLGITKKKTPKQKERERIRAKREQEKLEEKRRREEEKEKIRKEKQEQKEKERKEKEEKKEKERKEKEEKKEKERQEKEREKSEKQKQKEAEKQKLIDEKRQAKEEKNRKEEEKRKAEEEEQRKLQKAKSMFSSFFVKKPKEAEVEQEEQKEEDNKLFQEFRVKEDMVLAPGVRTALSACQSSRFERALAAPDRPDRDGLYLAELRSGSRQPQTRRRTLPPLQKDLEIIEEDDEEDKELDGLAQNIVLSSAAAATRKLNYKLLMFHENRRPAYWGTWSKRCSGVTGRRPLGRAQVLNYDEDSDDDWEEEDPNGESLSGSEKEVESEDDYEVDNEYFVPHGYLSDEEIKDKEEMMSPEAQKARLKEKGEEFDKQMKKKTTALKPRLIGCVWQDESNTDPMFQQLLRLLRPFAVRPLSALPVPTVVSGEVVGTPLAGPSPSDTPLSSAQSGLKFLKKFPDEALLPLARLVHGSTRGKPLLVREFATFWKRKVHGGSPRKADPAASAAAAAQTPPSAADGTPATAATGGPLLSKKKIEDKLCDIATYTRCMAEGPLQGRCCWMVREDVLATLGVELPLPSQWKWITKTAARRSEVITPGTSPAAAVTVAAETGAPAAAAPERPRPATSLITKFTKVVTAEEARSELLSPPAKRKIVPTKLISPQPPVVNQPAQPGIATFFKASPSAAAGPSTSAAAAGGTPKRRLAPTPVGPRPGPSSAAPAPASARRLTPTAVSAGQPVSARRLTPTAVPSGQSAARRLVPTPVTAAPTAKTPAGSAPTPVSASAPTPVSASAPVQAKSPTSAQAKSPIPVQAKSPLLAAAKAPAPAPSQAAEPAPRKITLISLPHGLPQLAKAAAAEPMEVTPAAADVETITLE